MLDVIKKNKFMILGLALVVGMMAWYIMRDTPASNSLLVTEDFSGASSEADKDLVATLLQLRAVTLDGAIFQDPAFQSLRDFGIQIVPEPVGRENPFAPLPASAAPAVPTGTLP
jgi:hypothetical protein